MLIPHFHFNGYCEEAIKLYKEAYGATVDSVIYNKDMTGDENASGIGHAEMHIQGQRVMLNDRFGTTEKRVGTPIQMVLTFKTEDELIKSYEIMKHGSVTIDSLQKAFYSPLIVIFIDRFGVQWSFMVEDSRQ